MCVFGNISKSQKPSKFENWLSENGYYYIKTKDNRPCFKSKLTQNLNQKFNDERRESNSSNHANISIHSFKFAR
uniref:Uncharacterized protein n=1 Tax=viral metagenome TaxID=1070528 RepID=A0A6C0KWQ5_9ZZZZ